MHLFFLGGGAGLVGIIIAITKTVRCAFFLIFFWTMIFTHLKKNSISPMLLVSGD